MKVPVTQEFDYGCGIACYAFVLGCSYQAAAARLGTEQAASTRFWIKDFVKALNIAGLQYRAKYVKPHVRRQIYAEGSIVLIKRSERYPSGHYLVRHHGHWMDPWINLPQDKNIAHASSGYRKRLPGAPMYCLLLCME